ncbi:MAG: glucose 1-dehydrogenase [Gemmatimonadetes bacterium]|nr:glucose 1-dehydrogenase [Gemmatimonadota bacterium]
MSTGVFHLTGKVAVVTGGGSGIGRSIAEVFAAHGAAVHILDVDVEAAEAVAAGVTGAATVHRCDVSDQTDVNRVFEEILGGGPVDILVNNAGVAHIGTAETTTEEDFDRLFRVNVKGVYNCTHAVLGTMKERKSGVIVNMASIAATSGIADRFAYSMTKGAVLAMTYSVAKDYATHGVRCVSISPARIHTPFVDGYLKKTYPGREEEMFAKLSATQPIGRMGEPREVAELALYLCSDAASFATGTDYPLDGGFLRLNG